LRKAVLNPHELVGFRVRKPSQEDAVDHTEHGGVGADPDSQGEQRGRGESGSASQCPHGVANVSHQVLHDIHAS